MQHYRPCCCNIAEGATVVVPCHQQCGAQKGQPAGTVVKCLSGKCPTSGIHPFSTSIQYSSPGFFLASVRKKKNKNKNKSHSLLLAKFRTQKEVRLGRCLCCCFFFWSSSEQGPKMRVRDERRQNQCKGKKLPL